MSLTARLVVLEVVALTACGNASTTPQPPPADLATTTDFSGYTCATGRVTFDQPDDAGGYQIHAMYVLPSDGTDERLDTSGAIGRSVSSFTTWFHQQSGVDLRVDLCNGTVDITFYRMMQTDQQIAATDPRVRDTIEQELAAKGMIEPTKIYAVYYGGSSHFACGGGAWPPTLIGHVAAEYLLGQVNGAPPCSSNPVGASDTVPGYFDFAMLHEIMHTLGVVATCAPHFTLAGHVSDSPTDLMYAGTQPWAPSVLDVGHDDYFGTGSKACLDASRSVFMEPLPAGAVKPPGW